MKIMREGYSAEAQRKIDRIKDLLNDLFDTIEEENWDDAYKELIAFIKDERYLAKR